MKEARYKTLDVMQRIVNKEVSPIATQLLTEESKSSLSNYQKKNVFKKATEPNISVLTQN